ncbi:MAG: L-threonylcarbamoyladenylate synthase [Flavobacteriaceae bacterium]|nr:L-threonylcarbamoyladenylate synthase [Flavobacteriaceae bacterium]
MQEIIHKTVEVLKSGGTILYPTDTIWGLGCDATNAEAVEKIYAIKQRPNEKALIVLMNTLAMLERYFPEIPEAAYQILELSDKPTTIIYDQPKGVAKNLVAADQTLAVRICKDAFCTALITKFNRPIVSTSANRSGMASPTCFNDVHKDIQTSVDYIVPLRQEEINTKASTIIKLGLDGQVKIIRS